MVIQIIGTVEREDLDSIDIGKVTELVEDVLAEHGYESELSMSYADNGTRVSDDEKREQRLVDVNNIDWNGLSYTQAFADLVDFLMLRQKEVKNTYVPEYAGTSEYTEQSNANPCNGCTAVGSIACKNECPYGY